MKKCLINVDHPFISDYQTPITADPREGSLNLPSFAISSELSSILYFSFLSIFSVWTYKFYLTVSNILSQNIAIISSVANQTFRAAFRPTRTISRYLDLGKNLINQCYFMRGCLGNGASQRNTLAVDHHHPLRSFAPFGFSNPRPLFLPVQSYRL